MPQETKQALVNRLRRQGYSRDQIIKETGMSTSTLYRWWPKEAKGRRGAQVSVPQGPPDDPFYKTVAVSMSHQEFTKLGTHPTMVAAQMVGEAQAAASLRKRVLRQLCQEDYPDVLTLMQAMRQKDDNFGSHEITHIIKSLNKQGLVTYIQNRQGSVVIPTRIRITERGAQEAGVGAMPKPIEHPSITRTGGRRHPPGYSRSRHAPGKDLTEQRHHRSVAVGGEVLRISAAEQVPMKQPLNGASQPVERPQAPAPVAAPARVPDLSSFPLLEELAGRFAENAANDAKAAKYAEAAAALEAIDPVRSEQLLDLAMQVGGKPFTPLEIEVLRFIEEVRRG